MPHPCTEEKEAAADDCCRPESFVSEFQAQKADKTHGKSHIPTSRWNGLPVGQPIDSATRSGTTR